MCNCNESAFSKLRESWSDHFKTDSDQCACCCASVQNKQDKSKVKGKFGVAYIIETPTKKCRPCGWEVEFNDTPSKIENNCKKMMNWITCPPLGECQNNETNLCCQVSDDVCGCSKQKKSGGDCCCQKAEFRCRCKRKDKEGCGTSSKKNDCCCRLKKQETNTCCRAAKGQQTYFKAKCPCQEAQTACQCCNKTVQYCCRDSIEQSNYSQSSIEHCCCQRETKQKCTCKCTQHKTKAKRHQKKGTNTEETVQKASKDKMASKPSKNLISPEPKKERQKNVQKSPYTISSNEIPKKGPDKEFHDELVERIKEINEPKLEVAAEKDETTTIKAIDKRPNDISETQSVNLMNDIIQVELPPNEQDKENKDQERKEQETREQEKREQEKREQEKREQEKKEQEKREPEKREQEKKEQEKKPKKKVKRRDLLRKIKEEHRKELEAIHPKSQKDQAKESKS